MAWYSDEQYMMIQDSREKKSIAASAFKQKTHCGKGGAVKFPSDYLSNKELKAMNGECKSYRMNDPISWSEFLEWPNEHKITYIKRIREKFGADDKHIAEMFGVACNIFLMYVKELGLEAKTECDENWEHNKFYAWRSGAKTELVNENKEEPVKEPDLTKPMRWLDFKTLTDEQMIAYIQGIRNQFGARDGYIADMLGVHHSTFAKTVISRLGIGLGKGAGKKNWDRDGFEKWCDTYGKEDVTEKPVSVPLEEVVDEDKAERINSLCQEVMNTINTDELFQKHVENLEAAENALVKLVKAVEAENTETVNTHVEEVHKVTQLPYVDEREYNEKTTCELAFDCEKKRIHDAGPIAFTGNSMPVIPKSGSMTFENNFADDALQVMKVLLGNARVKLSISWECC